MTRYALLILPSANRVYADASVRLTRSELEVFDRCVLGGRIGEVEETVIGGVPYVGFTAAGTLGERDAAMLANLSSAYAPYGVQHGSRTAGAGLSRGPADLLAKAVPVWVELLRDGGALGISWNRRTAGREDLAAIMSSAGLEVLDAEPYRHFEHRVDQAIVRDLIVARKG